MPETVTEAYRVISGGVLEGFRNLGLDAHFSVPETGAERELKKPKSAVCFDAPSWYELVVEGKKVAGSAQTRQKGVILQHGAILLSLDEENLCHYLNLSRKNSENECVLVCREKAVAIDRLMDRTVSLKECIEAFSKGFEEALDMQLEPLHIKRATT